MEGGKKTAIPVEIEQPEVMDVNVLEAKDVHDYDHSQTVNLDEASHKALAEGLGEPKTPQPKRSNIEDVLNLPPRTTAQEDMRTLGQRRVNLLWEGMQALIAGTVVSTALYVAARLTLVALLPDVNERQMAMAITAFLLISNLVSLVIGFYFGRTNHARIGDAEKPKGGSLDDRFK